MVAAFRSSKISLHKAGEAPAIAAGTVPGSGNFCILAKTPLDDVAERLREAGVEIVAGPGERVGATGPIWSVYCNDPDGNLVEISNPM